MLEFYHTVYCNKSSATISSTNDCSMYYVQLLHKGCEISLAFPQEETKFLDLGHLAVSLSLPTMITIPKLILPTNAQKSFKSSKVKIGIVL